MTGRALTAIQTSFNAGEVSPRVQGRIDLAFYGNALEKMRGFLPTIEGPAVAAPGTIYVENAAGPTRLIPFEFNTTQAYIIEASANKFRFYTNNVRIETAPGVPYEIATPYSFAEVEQLDFQQSADVLYLVCGTQAPRKLSRLTATTFSLDLVTLKAGPFVANSEKGKTVTPSGVSGSVTLTANTPIFEAGHVGALFRLEPVDFGYIPGWEAGMKIETLPRYCTWNGRVYLALGVGRTGTSPPIHPEGVAQDGFQSTDINDKGPYGIAWQFVCDGYGYGVITAVTNSTHATLSVQRVLPFTLGGVTTYRWSFGAFSTKEGWPTAVAIWNERLCFGRSTTIWGSVVGDYENFADRDGTGQVTADSGFTATLANPNTIRWMVPDKKLIVGTARAEHVVGPAGTSQAFGPTNNQAPSESTFGSADVRPVLADGRVLFVQKSRKKLIQLDYTVERDRIDGIDQSRFAAHLPRSGIVDVAWCQEPERHLWVRLGDGSLAAILYDPSQQALGWAARPLPAGMTVESIARIPDPAGEDDQLWLAVLLGGQRMILRMAPIWRPGDDPQRVYMSDAALMYDGPPVSTIAGLGHLAGRSLDVLADGSSVGPLTVSGSGTITLAKAASVVVAGLPFEASMKTLRPAISGPAGTSQAKIKRIPTVTLRLSEAGGLQIAVQGADPEILEQRPWGTPTDAPPPLFTGDFKIEPVGDYERDGQIEIRRIAPMPSTVMCLLGEVLPSDR